MQKNLIDFDINDKTIRNHTVPQVYLRFFESNTPNTIFIYDKKNNNTFSTGLSGVAAENKLYVIDNKDYNIHYSWENYYKKQVDDTIKSVFNEILSNVECVANIKPLYNHKLRSDIINIILHQTNRIRPRIYSHYKEYPKEMDELFNDSELINKYGYDNIEKIKSSLKEESIYKDLTLSSLNNVSRNPKAINALLNKTWTIFCNYTNTDFITSDNPVVIYDYKNKYTGIENGLDTQTTLISYPISPKYMIVIFPNEFLAVGLKLIYNFMRIPCYKSSLIEFYNKKQYDNSIRQVFARRKLEFYQFL